MSLLRRRAGAVQDEVLPGAVRALVENQSPRTRGAARVIIRDRVLVAFAYYFD